MVAFDLDVNKDGRPDQVYAIRVNGLAQIIDRRILNATVGTASSKETCKQLLFTRRSNDFYPLALYVCWINFKMSAKQF